MKNSWPELASIALTAMWLGAALLLAASVAPAAFDVLPSRTLAGALVGRILPVVFVSGIAVAAVAALLSGRASWTRYIAPAAVAVACAFAQFGLGPRIAKLRTDIGVAVDSLPVDDPQRILFGQLHAMSVAFLGAAMIGAVVILVMQLLAMRQRLHGAR
ncbi:MAG TPA: DUF4149 domain-containing protein [Gemmatimonadaceae bacterium]|nr:DUF4149 domain-containing protein [Gemmatimonadaceae bacterium]